MGARVGWGPWLVLTRSLGPDNPHSWWLTGPVPVPALVLGDTLTTAPLWARSNALLVGTVPWKAAPDARDGSLPSLGSLIQVPMSEKGKITRGRLGSLSLKKEGERQCFLFSKHLIICTRGSGGKLHLTKVQRVGVLGGPQQRVWWLPGLELVLLPGVLGQGLMHREGAEAGNSAAQAGQALLVTPGVQGPPCPPLAAASWGCWAESRRSVGFISRGPDALSVMCGALSHGQRQEIASSR